jgi:hypothetical protein
MIQLAWRFLMFQKDSALAHWFYARTKHAPQTRKTMIVALARKLLIALWRLNSTPAASRARRMARSFAAVSELPSSATSARSRGGDATAPGPSSTGALGRKLLFPLGRFRGSAAGRFLGNRRI